MPYIVGACYSRFCSFSFFNATIYKGYFFMVLLVSGIFVAAFLLTILKLLQKARKAEAAARKAATIRRS